MKICESCGKSKPEDAVQCPSCEQMDKEVMQALVNGTPSLTILILVLLAFWVYRFWVVGWSAIGGNLRTAAFVAIGLGVSGLIFGPMWTFGVRSRKKAMILLIVATVAFLIFNLF